MRRCTVLMILFLSITTALTAAGITEGSTYAKTILQRNDDVSLYFKQAVEPYTFRNGPLQMTVVPLVSETYLLSEYPDMKNKRYSTSQMVDRLEPFINELDAQQEKSGAFFVYLRYEYSKEILNTSSFTIDPNFFNYMFLDNDRGEYLRVSEFSVTGAHRVDVAHPVYEFLVRFGKNASERESFFDNAKEISISVTDFGFEGESVKFMVPLSQLFSHIPEDPHELIKIIRSSYKVRFSGANIEPLHNQSFGNTIPEPVNPERHGYTFSGWYKDSSFHERWDFQNDSLMGDTTLYAKWEKETAITSGVYYNITDVLFLIDGQMNKHTMPSIGAGYLAGFNYEKYGITLGAGIGLNLLMASDILSPPSAEYAENHYANLTLFLPVVSFNPGVFNLAIITDVSLHDLTWSSKLAAKCNLGWISFSLGVGYFSEAEKVLPYFGIGLINGLLL